MVCIATSQQLISSICFPDTWVLFGDLQPFFSIYPLTEGTSGVKGCKGFLFSRCKFHFKLAISNLLHQIPLDLALRRVINNLTEGLSNLLFITIYNRFTFKLSNLKIRQFSFK